MKTVELFAGIGGFRIAAERCGLNTVWANDICPKACKVYRDRFDDPGLHEGDIKDLIEGIPRHDLLTGGFPCQPFSSAGKKQGIEDPRGTLFSKIVEVLKRHEPRYFVLENVKRLLTMERGKHFATVLASLSELNYEIEWRLLNAVDFGLAQNRQRVFIIGRRSQRSSHVNGSSRSFSVRLATISDFKGIRRRQVERINCPEAWWDIVSHGVKFPTWGLARSGKYVGTNLTTFSSKSKVALLLDILEKTVGEQFDFTESTIKRLKASDPVHRFVDGVEILSNQGGGARMGYTVFGVNGVAPTLTSTASRHYERYKVGSKYRRLTNVEYARLQGFDDDHCSASSVYSQYALFGNAVPPPMAEWVIRQLLADGIGAKDIQQSNPQMELFSYAE